MSKKDASAVAKTCQHVRSALPFILSNYNFRMHRLESFPIVKLDISRYWPAWDCNDCQRTSIDDRLSICRLSWSMTNLNFGMPLHKAMNPMDVIFMLARVGLTARRPARWNWLSCWNTSVLRAEDQLRVSLHRFIARGKPLSWLPRE